MAKVIGVCLHCLGITNFHMTLLHLFMCFLSGRSVWGWGCPQNHSGHPKNIYIFSYIIVKILLHNYSMVPSVKSDKRISQRQDKTGKTFIFFLCWLMWSRPIKLDAPIMNISFAPPKLLSQLCSCVVSSIMHWGYCFMSKFTLSWHPEVDNDTHDQLAYINCV